ncbi:pC62L [African swine fever virus]|uniref:PC62L n=1 Tax=African swine fever virus TaxID=10497 RepID=A0A894KTC0_ASF|nr:pC62L [African swine fever virus]
MLLEVRVYPVAFKPYASISPKNAHSGVGYYLYKNIIIFYHRGRIAYGFYEYARRATRYTPPV